MRICFLCLTRAIFDDEKILTKTFLNLLVLVKKCTGNSSYSGRKSKCLIS